MQTFRLNFVLNPLNSELLFDTVKTERCVGSKSKFTINICERHLHSTVTNITSFQTDMQVGKGIEEQES